MTPISSYEVYVAINEKMNRIHAETLALSTYVDFLEALEPEVCRWLSRRVEDVIECLKSFKKRLDARAHRQSRLGDFLG